MGPKTDSRPELVISRVGLLKAAPKEHWWKQTVLKAPE